MTPARPDVSPWHVALVALLAATFVLQPVLAAPITSDWPQARGDAGRTAATPGATGPTGGVGPAWVNDVDTVASRTELTVADGSVYVGTHRGRAVAFDAESGQQEWRTPVGDRVSGTPSAVADLVVVPASTEDESAVVGSLVGLDRRTGAERWRYTPEERGRSSSWFYGDPAVANGMVYVSTAFGSPDLQSEAALLAVGPDGNGSAEERWRYELDDEYEFHRLSEPAVADGTVYVAHHAAGGPARSYVVAFDAATGERQWRTPINGAVEHVVVADGAVLATGSSITRLDATTGAIDVRLRSRSTRSLPTAYADGILYVPTNGADGAPDRIAAVDATTGRPVWTRDVRPGDRIEAGPTLSSRYVFVPTASGEVVAFHRENGTVAWHHTVDSRLGISAPVTPHGETVYVAAGDLYALREDGHAVATGFLGWVGGRLRQHAALGVTGVALGAGVTMGLVLGALSLAGIHLAGLSRSPQRLLAGRLFQVSTTYVRPWQRYVAHLLASVAIAVGVAAVAMAGWLALPVASALVTGLLPALAPGLSLLWLTLALGAVTLVVGPFWAVLTYRWLPANQFGLDKPLAAVRRDWTLVHVGFSLGLALVFPLLVLGSVLVASQVL